MKHVKKLCSFILVCILFSAMILIADAAENYIVLYGFAFDINTDGDAVIHSYDDRAADVVIPQKLMGANVTTIDDYAFFNDSAITSVAFDDATALKSIGINAFYGCSGLTSLTIPEWIEALSFGAFQNCTSLDELNIENGIALIPAQCFYGCSSLKQVAVPESVTVIGERAFMNCSELSIIEIADSVLEIADNAFDGCENPVIYCTKDSYALRFATEHSIRYVITDADPKPILYVLGDADGNGDIEVVDAAFVQRYIAQIATPYTKSQLMRGDVDGSGDLELTDATNIQRYLVRLKTDYPIGTVVS